MWMNDVTAAWVMTSLTTSPVMVALVQTASTLPVFLLGLPSGALADIVDRRRYFAVTQLWVAATALALAVQSLTGLLTAPLLLALTFVNGVGLAMRWPVFAAIVPTIVGRGQLSQALALNGIAMNLARVIGPVLAGGLIAAFSPAAVFVLNTLLAGVAFTLILRWRHERKPSALPGERFVGAMRVGLGFAMQSPRLKVILLRVFVFFLQSAALMALLPLVARDMPGGGPGLFTVLLSALGVGAVVAATQFPRWRAEHDLDGFVRAGTVMHAAVSILIVAVPKVWIALPAIVIAGMAWISVANSLTLAAQSVLPDWVRARGMAVYQMALMGGAAAGSFLWGQVASYSSIGFAIVTAGVLGVLVLALTRKFTIAGAQELDFTPQPGPAGPPVLESVDDEAGPVMVSVSYRIAPENAAAFRDVMQRTRRARLRQGALSWGLFHDTSEPGRWVEVFVDENWLEHQRRLERFTAFDAELRERRLALHIGPEPPLTRRYVADAVLPPPAI